MAKAKTASKNNPTTREKVKVMLHNGKPVKPFRFMGTSSTYMAAQYDTGEIVKDANGKPLAWKKIKRS